jgi:tRNA 2-thiouridine synthesizing protein B
MLHLIFQTPLTVAVVERLGTTDSIVLQGAAVWNALQGHVLNASLSQLLQHNASLYVLQEDLQVNGIDRSRLLPGVEVISYDGLVDLTVAIQQIQTWR